MAPLDNPFNPLAINLRRQTQHLGSIVPPGTPCIAQLQAASNTQEFLQILSNLLANPAYTHVIATLFRPILLDLCARWIEAGSEDRLVALCYLVEVHEELFPILSRVLQTFFATGPLGLLLDADTPTSVDPARLHRLLLSYFRILQANRQLSRQLQWSLTPLSKLIWAEDVDNATKLLAIKCYAIQTEMGEIESEKLERQILGQLGEVDCPLEYGMNVDCTKKEADGWLVETLEIQRVRKERSEIVAERIDFFGRDEGEPPSFMESSDLSPLVENVEGVLLLKSSKLRGSSPDYIPIPSSNTSLTQLAHHVSLRLPTLLTSTPSAGKALLLHHLANLLHPDTKNQVVTLHLADTSLDARSLLGSYISSSTQSGSFEWKEGVLVRAMREGKWIVLEDVDRGSNEVLGTLKPLVESLSAGKWVGGRASIQIPGRGEVVAHESFLIFATRSLSLSPNSKFPSPTFFGAHKFYEIALSSPPLEELNTIISGRFPTLSGASSRACIHLWDSLNGLRSTIPSSKEFGLRDLLKFCRRVERLLPSSYQSMDVDTEDITLGTVFTNPVLREDIYIEARDVFFGAGTMTPSSKAAMDVVASLVGMHLGLDSERCVWLTQHKTPELHVETDANGTSTGMRISRTYLPARKSTTPFTSNSRPFALHRPAICLLSRIATAVALQEPVLLIGETGTGKTSVVTHLAHVLRRPLISLNLSNQTESSDLIGGLKPVDARLPGSRLQERFSELFGATFSRKKNEKFESSIRKAVNEGKWKRVVGLWKESVRLAQERFDAKKQEQQEVLSPDADRESGVAAPRKRRKLHESTLEERELRWTTFLRDVEEFEIQHVQGKGKFAFAFVEGPLIKALRNGDWILLDEINLASPETLESISSLLHGPTASITLTEHGELEPVPRHPEFRLFACMNPATDVGKKDLPPNIRTRFTEIDVPPPDADKETLLSIVDQYIGSHAVGDKGAIMNVAEFYLAVKDLSHKRLLADGSNHRPHYSMRTLSRALTFAADIANTYSLRRGIWEGCLMAFTMVLDSQSAELVTTLAHKHLLAGVRNPRSMLAREPNAPENADEFVKVGPFYLAKGPLTPESMDHYIMTPSVEAKLKDLARIILTRRFPILIEGPTSAGKTSSIEYLAKRTGHEFIRINNHEHTDIQEYIGSYVSDPVTGKLVFRDGLLVQALRKGSWIVLDELNLAPTDVLEALNRLLDDNRELVIPETQEVVRPHPHFMLFATQNPPGLYAGRKVLSRAFRNRFLEVHFEDVPQAELEVILCQRCRIAPSYGKKIVEVFRQLQKRRQSSRVFESKQGFVTLRDLFRWAGREAVGYQQLAEDGYMLLAERARREEDKVAVREVLETVMNVRIDEVTLYDPDRYEADLVEFLGCAPPASSSIVWTKAMRRLFVLLSRALKFKEPVLLVGETGSGKTSVCQVFADAVHRKLHGLSCHQNTETADIIGGLRPLRNRQALAAETMQEAANLLSKVGFINPDAYEPEDVQHILEKAIKSSDIDPTTQSQLEAAQSKIMRAQSIFEWRDGPLIEAMRNGEVFLLDEISLAEDSVLERLNSVLEPERTIVLAERGGGGEESPHIQAEEGFRLVATMNPGGDYGKKELSPALRNRFTEIWVPQVDDRHDLELITSNLWKSEDLKGFTIPLLDFIEWLSARIGDRSILTLRDILAWITFMNCMHGSPQCTLDLNHLFHHAAHLTYLDGLSALPQLSSYSRDAVNLIKKEAVQQLAKLVPLNPVQAQLDSPVYDGYVKLGPFDLKVGEHEPKPDLFTLAAPTTQDNALRLTRACQVPKPILLEGSPGVGKTSLVVALANMTGQKLHRINLSDQTDLVDLFGSDLPVEGGRLGEFAWRDGEFLQALQLGHWVLLDEMNLAPQAVLEGLNAVLDHRGSVYIPELGRSFSCHPSFRIFAAQNPLNQGGGRKGLPKSFINRFTKVYIEELTADDYLLVCQHLFPDIEEEVLQAMIAFNTQLNQEVVIMKTFARDGFPWEFNLRDVIRWGSLMTDQRCRQATAYIGTVYIQRFRTEKDRKLAQRIAEVAFSRFPTHSFSPALTLTPSIWEVGHVSLRRQNFATSKRSGRLLQKHLTTLETLGDCISQSWLAIVVGGRNSGKTELIRSMASIMGHQLREVSVNSATDTMDILGSFEQVDVRGQVTGILDELSGLIESMSRTSGGCHALATSHNIALELQSVRNEPDIARQLQRTAQLLTKLNAGGSGVSDVFASLRARANALAASDGAATGRFEWIDGPLVKALKLGQWILLDGANLCNPSVLDRLNSLCETNGRLVLSERGFVNGQVEVISPHIDFRLFMTVDPHYGELSRAMRNRGIEITLTDGGTSEDIATSEDYVRLPCFVKPGTFAIPATVVQFDAVRRGRALLPSESCRGATTSLGIMQSSSRSPVLLNQIETLAAAATHSPDAHVPFIIRSSIPDVLPLILRHDTYSQCALSSDIPSLRPLIQFLSTKHFQESLTQFHNMANAGSAAMTASAKPIDIYTIVNGPLAGGVDEGLSSPHAALINYLDLVALPFIFGEKFAATPVAEHLPDTHAAFVLAIDQIVISAQETVKIVSNAYLDNPYAHSDDARRSGQLLAGALSLKDAVRTVPLDYSRVLANIRWLSELLNDAGVVFSSVSLSARRVQEMLSLTRGFCLIEVWEAFYTSIPQELAADLDRYSQLSQAIKDQPKYEAVRRQILNTMSVALLHPKDFMDRYIELRSKLDSYLSAAMGSKMVGDEAIERLHDPGNLTIELSLLSHTKGSKASKNLQRFIHLACGDESMPIVHLVPFQRLSWSLQEDTGVTQAFVLASINWLEATWRMQESALIPAAIGPGNFNKPIHLVGALQACAAESAPLIELESYTKRLILQSEHLYFECDDHRVRPAMLQTFFSHSLHLIASCFSNSLPKQISTAELPNLTLDTWVATLLQCSNLDFRQAVEKYLQPLCQLDELQASGLRWIALSRMLLTLTVPNIPIDPASISNHQHHRLSKEKERLESQLSLHLHMEKLLTGADSNEIVLHIQSQLDNVLNELRHAPHLPERHDIARLHQFWGEASQFLELVLSPSKIDSLAEKLRSGDVKSRLEEEVLQESLSSFYQRLDSLYRDFSDIVIVIKLAIQYFRFGLRLQASLPSRASGSDRFMPAIVAYPSVRSAELILNRLGAINDLGASAFRGIVLGLAAMSVQSSLGMDLGSRVPILDELYQQARGLWNIDRAKERDDVAASSTLYRHSKVDYSAMTDAEVEEHEFLLLFPNFEDVLDEKDDIPQKKPEELLLAPSEQVSMLCDLHLSLMSPKHNSNTAESTFRNLRRRTMHTLLEAIADSSSDSLDHDSLAFRFTLLNDQVKSVASGATSPLGPNERPNFYVDPNVPEIRKVVPVLVRLLGQLEALQLEWPDQEVLRHLGDLCRKVLDLSLHSPIAKILSAIEQLLLRTEDWEMYANRENTLREHREALISQIVDWRRLELANWHALLDSEAKGCQRNGSRWWFDLYDATIRGVLSAAAEMDAGEESSITTYFRSLVPLLSDFISSSTLGDFSYRVSLLESFSTYSALLAAAKKGREQNALNRASALLLSTRRYFDQYSVKMSARMATDRAALEKEIKNFIKLASWKDINVLALKQSAQRSHHQLYKVVRKFRDVLRQPVSSLLSPEFISSPQQLLPSPLAVLSNDKPLVTPPADLSSAVAHIANLRRTFAKFESLVNDNIRPMISNLASTRAEDLATDIISTCHRLASISVPTSITDKEKRTKFLKSVQSQKRKAWADLLKEMKHSGFSHRVKPEVLSQNLDSLWVKEQPLVPTADEQAIVERLESYFFKLQGCLPALRVSASSHHDDVNSRDLSKGTAVVEGIYNVGVTLRASLANSLTTTTDLEKVYRRISNLNTSSLLFYGENLLTYLKDCHAFFCQASRMMSEVASAIRNHHLPKTSDPSLAQTCSELERWERASDDAWHRLQQVADSVRSSRFFALQAGESEFIESCATIASTLERDLQAWAVTHPQLVHLFVPSHEWVVDASRAVILAPTPFNRPSLEARASLEALVNSLLVTIQTASLLCSKQIDVEENDDRYLTHITDSIRHSNNALSVGAIHSQVMALLANIHDSEAASECIPRILPFLQVYLELSRHQLVVQAGWVKSLFKLDYVLASVMQTIATQGFCRPPEDTNEGGEEGAETSTSEGMGLGEGSGKDNVSKEIEDEGQVEGLKGDDADDQPQERNKDEKEDALEMTEDFGGDLEDVPDDGSEEEKEESDDEEGSDVDPEERIEDLDPTDPNAVDEKLWGDEENPANEKDSGDQSKQDDAKTEDGKSEMAAKESKDQKDGKQKEDEQPETSEDAPERDGEDQPEEEEGDQGTEDQDQHDPKPSGAAMDEHIPEGDVLDLPDDMDLGEEKGDDEQMDDLGNDELDGMEDEEMPAVDDDLGDEDGSMEESTESGVKDNAQDDEIGELENQEPDLTAEAGDGDEEEKPEDEEAAVNEVTGRADVSNGDEGVDAEDQGAGSAEESAASGQAGASSRGGQRGAESEEKADNEQGPADKQNTQTEPQDADQAQGTAAADGQQGENSTESEYKDIPNPLRSMGDALKEIQQRFDEILNQDSETPQVKAGDVSEKDQQLEYLRPDDEDVDMQALGPADQHDAAKLNELKMAADEEENEGTADAPMDLNPELEEFLAEQAPFEPFSSGEQRPMKAQDLDVEGAILQHAQRQTELLNVLPNDTAPKTDSEKEELDHAVEAELRSWRANDYTSDGAERLWRMYESLTHDLAYSLCEQLRLILEPTLATRLKGDYRTGKRLNMKKVISYIASDYTKDKIWLRRTKPSQREYQVLIAIDDSRSMAESHSIHLAYETLALLGKALNRLESGDISVVKFGEAVEVVHGFDDGPLTDQAGAKVIDAFRFNQKATNVLSLLESSLSVLDSARERRGASSSSAADLWQLEIIISDGMCQDHEKLRTMLRRAEEKRIMVVFIILDSLHTNPKGSENVSKADAGKRSILHMDKAEFKNVDGRMELQLQKYLDSFPFEYYVVLRDVEALPDVLSSTLKQFFERISEQ